MDPTSALQGISAAISLLDQAAKLVGSFVDVKNKKAQLEIQEKLGEAQGKIAQVTAALTEEVAENYRLQNALNKAQDEVKAAMERLRARADGTLHSGVRWIRGIANAYCPVCFGKTEKDIPLIRYGHVITCSECKISWSRPQPPPDFGIPPITYPPDPPKRTRDDESEFTRGRY